MCLPAARVARSAGSVKWPRNGINMWASSPKPHSPSVRVAKLVASALFTWAGFPQRALMSSITLPYCGARCGFNEPNRVHTFPIGPLRPMLVPRHDKTNGKSSELCTGRAPKAQLIFFSHSANTQMESFSSSFNSFSRTSRSSKQFLKKYCPISTSDQ